jgi:hypothetical protein
MLLKNSEKFDCLRMQSYSRILKVAEKFDLYVDYKEKIVFLQPLCPGGEIGRHASLRGWCP